MEGMSVSVVDNTAQSRFELVQNGALAFATYRKHGDIYVIPHVEADVSLRGRGTAGRLMEGIAAIARDKHFKIRPSCPYARVWFQRHPEHGSLVD
jgi:predicted GNAT family acetyltransferase